MSSTHTDTNRPTLSRNDAGRVAVEPSPQVHPDLFRPMIASEVSRYAKLSTRTLEDWRRRTKVTGDLVGPPFFQDYEGGKVLYPEICVKRFAMARAAGRSIQEATRFAWQPLSDLCSELGWSLPDYQPKGPPETHRTRRS